VSKHQADSFPYINDLKESSLPQHRHVYARPRTGTPLGLKLSPYYMHFIEHSLPVVVRKISSEPFQEATVVPSNRSKRQPLYLLREEEECSVKEEPVTLNPPNTTIFSAGYRVAPWLIDGS